MVQGLLGSVDKLQSGVAEISSPAGAGKSASQLTHVVGRFQFLAGCWPEAQFFYK